MLCDNNFRGEKCNTYNNTISIFNSTENSRNSTQKSGIARNQQLETIIQQKGQVIGALNQHLRPTESYISTTVTEMIILDDSICSNRPERQFPEEGQLPGPLEDTRGCAES